MSRFLAASGVVLVKYFGTNGCEWTRSWTVTSTTTVRSLKNQICQDWFTCNDADADENAMMILSRLHLFITTSQRELQPDDNLLNMCDEWKLSDKNRDNFWLTLKVDFMLQVQVQWTNQLGVGAQHQDNKKLISIEERYNDRSTVLRIKKRLQATLNVALERMHLFWKDQELGDHEVVSSRLTEPDSTLLLKINAWVVHIHSEEGGVWTFGVDPTDTVASIQQKLKNMNDTDGSDSDDDYMLIRSDGVMLGPGRARGADPGKSHDSDATMSESIAGYGITNNYTIYRIHEPKGTADIRMQHDHTNKKFTRIAKPEHRGITLAQLRDLRREILIRCHSEGWTSADRRHNNKLLTADEVTLYDLMLHYILPVTSEHQCSYVELVCQSENGQIPVWFCSHWWGASVLQFISCLERHAFDRHLGDTATYWICAYALNQHDINQELKGAKNPKETPFYRAMQLTSGTISVVDEDANCYHRVWCAFEIAIVLTDLKEAAQKEEYFYDIYTAAVDRDGARIPVGITDGVVASDRHSKRLKYMRQSTFPLDLCCKALNVALEKAEASLPGDRTVILNSIIGNFDQLSSEPPSSHAAYDKLNATLRGKIAEAAYRMAVERRHPQIQVLRQALSDSPTKRLVMSFQNCSEFLNEATYFTQSLPTSLEQLHLGIGSNNFKDSGEFVAGLGRLQQLKALEFDAQNCKALEDLEHLWSTLKCLHRSEELALNFSGCSSLSQIHGLRHVIPSLANLTVLRLDFSFCNVTSIRGLTDGLAGAKQLVECGLNFSNGPLASLANLGEALERLESLKVLSFAAQDCCISGLDALVEGLSHVRQLSSLDLRVSSNSRLVSIDEVAVLVRLCPDLRIFKLQCGECAANIGVSAIVDALRKVCNNLESLRLNFERCPRLSGLDGLGKAITEKSLLKEIQLDFQYCDQLIDAGDFFAMLESINFSSLEKVSLNFSGDAKLLIPNLAIISETRMPKMTCLRLQFADCKGLKSISALAKSFVSMTGRQFDVLFMDLAGTSVSEGSVVDICRQIYTQHIKFEKLHIRTPNRVVISSITDIVRVLQISGNM